MSVARVDEIYEKYVLPLSASERLRLLERTARDLAELPEPALATRVNSILELRGLGKHIWQGIDPQPYVDELRDDWNR